MSRSGARVSADPCRAEPRRVARQPPAVVGATSSPRRVGGDRSTRAARRRREWVRARAGGQARGSANEGWMRPRAGEAGGVSGPGTRDGAVRLRPTPVGVGLRALPTPEAIVPASLGLGRGGPPRGLVAACQAPGPGGRRACHPGLRLAACQAPGLGGRRACHPGLRVAACHAPRARRSACLSPRGRAWRRACHARAPGPTRRCLAAPSSGSPASVVAHPVQDRTALAEMVAGQPGRPPPAPGGATRPCPARVAGTRPRVDCSGASSDRSGADPERRGAGPASSSRPIVLPVPRSDDEARLRRSTTAAAAGRVRRRRPRARTRRPQSRRRSPGTRQPQRRARPDCPPWIPWQWPWRLAPATARGRRWLRRGGCASIRPRPDSLALHRGRSSRGIRLDAPVVHALQQHCLQRKARTERQENGARRRDPSARMVRVWRGALRQCAKYEQHGR